MAIDRVSFGQSLTTQALRLTVGQVMYFELHANFQRQYLQIELYREYGLAKPTMRLNLFVPRHFEPRVSHDERGNMQR